MYEALIIALLAAIAITFATALRGALKGRRVTSALLIGMCCLHELVAVVTPLVYSLLTNFSFERAMVVSVLPEDLVVVLLGESLFVMGLLGVFCFGASAKRPAAAGWDHALPRHSLVLLTGLSAVGLIAGIGSLATPITSLTEVSEHAGARVYADTAAMVISWTLASFQFPALFAGGLLLTAPSVPRPCRALGAGALLPLAVFGAVTGLRSRVVWVIVSVWVGAIVWRAKRAMAGAAVSLLILVPFFAPMGDGGFRFSINRDLAGQSVFMIMPYLGAASRESFSGGVTDMADKIVFRAMSPRNSAILYRLHDGGSGAGMAPIVSAAYFPLPRVWWPGKRFAGSADSTAYGGAMYKVMGVGHGAPPWVMGPYLASAHAYWEGGWVFLALLGPLTGAVWVVICRFAENRGRAEGALYVMTFVSAFYLDGFFTGIAPLYVLIRAFWLCFLPVVLLSTLLRALSPRGARAEGARFPARWRAAGAYSAGPAPGLRFE